MSEIIKYQGITFDDVLLEPAYSDVVPADCDVRTRLTKRIELHIPLLSSPMDTVTEAEMAIALAQEGGIGIIHKNLSIERQVEEVDKVKRSANGIIVDPVTLPADVTVRRAREIKAQANVSGVPIVGADGKLAGILTRRDLRFLENDDTPIFKVMTKDHLVTATGTVTLEQAEKILMVNKVEKLLLVDENYKLTGLITIKDIDKMRRFPNACKDRYGRLRVGAAVGMFEMARVEGLIGKGVDVLVVDSAHGHSSNVIETVRQIKQRWDIDVVAGNVATEEGAADLIQAAEDHQMDVLCEVHDEAELARALALGCPLIGVNARNLATLTVEPILQRTLLSSVPKGFIAVAESGVTNRADLDAAGKAGASAALVGTAIMRNPELLVELTRP